MTATLNDAIAPVILTTPRFYNGMLNDAIAIAAIV